MDILIDKDFVEKYKKGYPILSSDFIDYKYNSDDEGKTVKLLDDKHKYIATAYLGKQNKGLGWVFSKNRRELFDSSFIQGKIKQALAEREVFFNDNSTNAFRLFNSYGDGIGGLTIDYYDGFLLIYWYNKGIFKFADSVINTLISELQPRGIYQKIKFDYTKEESYENHIYGEKASESFYILENRAKYCVDFDDGDMVGIFLDQRDVRKLLTGNFSKDKTLLNTFSYTGAFSVASLVGLSGETTSVDLAKRSLPRTIANLEVNDFKVKDQKIVVEDVFNFFKYAFRKELVYDIVILDPPSFAKSKKRSFSVLKDYSELVNSIVPLVKEKGYIFASTNNSKLSIVNFKRMLIKGLDDSQRKYKLQKIFRLPADFKVDDSYKEENYLKVVLIKLD